MALFKIEKGLSAALAKNRPNTTEGWCYFTTDDGKFYIDIDTKTGNTNGRIVLNAEKADLLTIGDVGGSAEPVYFKDGIPVKANAYSTLLGEFSSTDNTLTLSIDATTKTATIINSISHSWADGQAAGPKLTVTVNGKSSGTAAIPTATTSRSGVVTVKEQSFAGDKTFTGAIILTKDDVSYNPALVLADKNTTGSNSNFVYVNASGQIVASNASVGGAAQPVYLSGGTITECSADVGSDIVPVYMKAGSITASTKTVGAAEQPVYLKEGTITASTSNIGSSKQPIYMSSGILTKSTETEGSTTQPVYLKNGVITKLSDTVGATNTPVYLNKGVITQCSANIGSGKTPIYMSAGGLTASTETIGTTLQPIYLNKGTLTATEENLGSDVQFIYMVKGTLTTTSKSLGASDQLIYLSSGSLTASSLSRGGTYVPLYAVDGILTAGTSYAKAISSITCTTSSTPSLGLATIDGTTSTVTLPTLANLGGVSSVSASGTAPLTLSATKTGTSVSISGSVATAGANTLGVVKGFHRTSGTASGTKTTSASNAPAIASRSTTAGRYYGVETDANGYMFVNVPWSNTTSFSITANASDDDIIVLTGTSGTNAVTYTASHATSGVTAATYGPSANVSGSNGATISVPQITVNEYGHVTSIVNRTYTSVNTNTDTKVTTAADTATTKAYVTTCTGATTGTLKYHTGVYVNHSTGVLMGAAWNDFAEYRHTIGYVKPGFVVCENGNDSMSIATKRMQPAAAVVSDTFGFAIGQTDYSQTPIAVAGRVLVYPFENRESYHPGDAVCAAPGGTVSKMTREEISMYPERILGIVSSVPEYETWGETDVRVNGRIWIKIY